MRNIVIVFSLMVVLSCQDSEKIKNLELKEEKLKTENLELRNTIIELQEKVSVVERNQEILDSEKKKKSQENNSILYYFIVLEVTEKIFTTTGVVPGKEMFVTSDIDEVTNYNDNIKYKLLDKMVQKYNKDHVLNHKTTLNDRKIYTFDNYQQASEAREKYIMRNN